MSEYEIELYEIIGEMLRDQRLSKNLTLEQVAEKVGVIPKTIQRYETGERKIKINTLMQLTDLLGMEYEHFMTIAKMRLAINQGSGLNSAECIEFKADKEILNSGLIKNTKANNKILSIYNLLNEENQNRLLIYAKKLRDLQKIEEPILNAANSIPGASTDDKEHDEKIMDDDNF